MKIASLLAGILVLCASVSLSAKEAVQPLFLPPAAFQAETVLPPPPAPGSAAEKADLDGLHDAQAGASLPELKRAKQDSHDSVWDFAEILGPNFNPTALPKTAAAFNELDPDLKEAVKAAKNHFQRPRPPGNPDEPEADKDKKDYAYPSGHASRAYAWATLLADLYPERGPALLSKAGRMGWNRIILAKHYPADVAAGKLYGDYLAREFLKSPAFQARWKEARAEIAAAPAAN